MPQAHNSDHRRISRFCVAACSLLCALVSSACQKSPEGQTQTGAEPAASAHEEILETEFVTVQTIAWPTVVRTQGSLVADETSVLGAKVAGRVDEVHFDFGDLVSAGSSLIALDESELKLRVAQANAQLLESRAAIGLSPDASDTDINPLASPPVREAKTVLEEAQLRRDRVQRLLDRDAASQEEFQQAEALVKVAESRYASAVNNTNERIAQIRVRAAELDLARQQLRDAVTLAPFSGYVQERHVAPGSFVQLGQPLFTLVRTDMLRFRGTMPERHAQQLAIGQRVTLRLEAIPEPRQVQVTRISPAIDETNRSLLFEAVVDNKDQAIRGGLFAQAEVVVNPEAVAMVVPASAVMEFAGAEKVWKVIDGVAQEQLVQSGQRREDGVEIVSGLSPGDRILAHANRGRAGPVRESKSARPVDVAF